MPQSNFKRPDAAASVSSIVELQVENVQLHQFGEADAAFAAGSPFANAGLKADRWKAYMEFDICHSLPLITGPVMEGYYTAYTPQTLAMSHASLLHQQVNLNHLLKAYDAEGDKASGAAKDRIVGCVVATFFPDQPMGGWKAGADSTGPAPSIRACAAIFKLADGVNRMMGDHQTSRKKQSVSIECVTSYDNIGIFLPSRGVDQIVPILDVTEEAMTEALSLDPLKIGKINGEQPVFIFGIGKPVEFRGVGITPRPAEAAAKILSFQAEKKTIDGGTLIAMAASAIDQNLLEKKVEFRSRRVGVIRAIHTEDKARLKGLSWGIEASVESPVLDIEMPDKRHVLKKMSDVANQIRDLRD